MGRAKQLLPIQNEPALVLCIRRILAAGFAEIIVVVGHNRDVILPVLADLPVTTVVNPEPDSQMADSVQAGLAALPSGITGIAVGLADHPLVLSCTYALLGHIHRIRPDRILMPTYRSRNGHPTLFPASLCRSAAGTPMNRIIADHQDILVRIGVEDPGVVMDMDYPADYRRLASYAAGN
ncbi:MAG: nucleotidyltransferase family protein [Desulfobulbaceae bacterium]|nr:nucleotidyltransferase family protein [Desulfobulbaceae bacterium]